MAVNKPPPEEPRAGPPEQDPAHPAAAPATAANEPVEPEPAPDEDDGLEDDPELADLLRKVAAAPSIDPTTLSRGGGPAGGRGLSPGEQLGHFKIVARIGAGGMGVVYRAEDDRLRRLVALKVLPAHQVYDRERRKRLWREAQSAAAVNHPNIASIFELGEAQDGTAFIAMEYLDGMPLRGHLAARRLSLEEVLSISIQVATGLARAHQAGVVHRDLKPENVMVLPDGTAKILDFGLAKLLAAPDEAMPTVRAQDDHGSAATKDGQVVGTPRYMSPEQKDARQVDARSDVYSFGVVLTEMLGAGWPTPGDRTQQTITVRALQAHGNLDPVHRSLLERLAAVAACCMASSPADRYGDGLELLAALRALELGSEIGGEPRRHRPVRWAVGLSAAALLLAVAGVLWSRSRAVDTAAAFTPTDRPRVSERRLTANPPDNPVVDAMLSQDGTRLAYVDRAGLFMRGLDPPWTEQLATPPHGMLQSVSWLPEGKEVLVSTGKPGEPGATLWRVPRRGRPRKVDTGLFVRPRVSPDGTRLAWLEPKGIAVGSIDEPRTTGQVIVTAARGDVLDQVSWSADGTRLAYLRVTRSEQGVAARIETVDALGGAPHVLVDNPRLVQEAGNGAMSWGPDGRIIFALAERPPRETGFTLYGVMVEAGTGRARESPRLLHSWAGSTPSLLTSGAGGVLALARTETQSDVYAAELLDRGRRLAHPRRITPSDRNERPSGWTLDSAAVLYTSDQEGSNDVFSQRLESGEVKRLLGGRPAETWPQMIEDGAALLYWEHPFSEEDTAPHQAELRRLELRGGGEVTMPVLRSHHPCDHAGADLPPKTVRFRCPRAGPCLVGELEGAEWVFRTFDLEKGEGPELLRVADIGVGLAGWDLTADGTRLAFPGAHGQVRVVEVATGKFVDRFVQQDCVLQHVAWSADGTGVYATGVCGGDRPYQLFFTELGRPAQLLWDSSSTWFGLPVVSPDGSHLAFAVRPYDNDVWLAAGL